MRASEIERGIERVEIRMTKIDKRQKCVCGGGGRGEEREVGRGRKP